MRIVVRRTHVVWASFLGAMTLGCAVLMIADGSLRSVKGAPMLGPSTVIEEPSQAGLFDTAVPVDTNRWRGILIHHSGSPAGDAGSLNRLHLSHGLEGLGYHFVIGNGNGMGDGVVHIGYRWNNQAPGAHAIGDEGAWHNQHSIAICLIGNGETRPFSERQIAALTTLITELQRRFQIPADRVLLHRDVAEVASPGRYFAEAAVRERLPRD